MAAKYALWLRTSEISQVLSYVNARDDGADGGWYYGNKEDFERRHKRILKAIETCDWKANDKQHCDER